MQFKYKSLIKLLTSKIKKSNNNSIVIPYDEFLFSISDKSNVYRSDEIYVDSPINTEILLILPTLYKFFIHFITRIFHLI